MSRGYLILAQNNKDHNYLKLAYVLALSIKVTQSTVTSVSLVTDVIDAVPKHYKKVFDNIIEIPWYDDALNSDWKIENRWKLYHISPYDETVILDSDMLFLSDVSNWWNYLSTNHDICFTTSVKTYRNELISSDYYRKAFTANRLPNFYSAFVYFKKTDKAKEYWELVEIITKNWKKYYQKFLPEHRPKFLSMDVVFALAAKILCIEDELTSSFDYPNFVHMKSKAQNWKNTSDDWMENVGIYLNEKGSLKIGNYQQHGIFHYTDKNFMMEHMLYTFEDLYKEKNHG
jgi:hypothetical protein